MTPLTLYLARLAGFYCLIVAASMLLRRRETIAAINAMVKEPGQIMLAGVIALGAGQAMILGHNDWSGGPLTIAVTLFGWAATVKGTALLVLPSGALEKGYAALNYERLFSLYMIGTLALGGGLVWASFR